MNRLRRYLQKKSPLHDSVVHKYNHDSKNKKGALKDVKLMKRYC